MAFSTLYTTIFFDIGNTLIMNHKWVPGGLEALTELSKNGFKLGIISNTGDMSRSELISQLPVDFRFDLFVQTLVLLSSEVRLQKPDLAIFQLALNRSDEPASKCLFCTEDLTHTLAAQQAGLQTIRLHNPPNGDLEELVQLLLFH